MFFTSRHLYFNIQIDGWSNLLQLSLNFASHVVPPHFYLRLRVFLLLSLVSTPLPTHFTGIPLLEDNSVEPGSLVAASSHRIQHKVAPIGFNILCYDADPLTTRLLHYAASFSDENLNLTSLSTKMSNSSSTFAIGGFDGSIVAPGLLCVASSTPLEKNDAAALKHRVMVARKSNTPHDVSLCFTQSKIRERESSSQLGKLETERTISLSTARSKRMFEPDGPERMARAVDRDNRLAWATYPLKNAKGVITQWEWETADMFDISLVQQSM